MDINGVWKVELLTMYDWEPRATAFFKDGTYWGASSHHYAVGTYKIEGTRLVGELSIVTHGKSGALFGKNADSYDIVVEADVSGDQFISTAKDKNGTHLVQYRFTRLGDLP